MKAKQTNRSTQPRLKKISMSLLLILGSAPAWALQTNIGTTCGATGTITCTAGTQNNVTVDGSAASTAIQSTVVWQGGEVNNNTVLSTGKLTLNTGAVANGTVLQSTGIGGFSILAGGTANNTTVTLGQMVVDGVNAKANNTIVNGGSLSVTNGASAVGITLNAGTSYAISAAHIENATVNSGATLNMYGLATADGITIKSGGIQTGYEAGSGINYGGATMTNTIIEAGGRQNTSYSSHSIDAQIYGRQDIAGDGGDSTGSKIYTGGVQNIYAGGKAFNTVINGGVQNVGAQSSQPKGFAYDSIVNDGGLQRVSMAGSIVYRSTVNAGGALELNEGTRSEGNLNVNGSGVAQMKADATAGAYAQQVSLNDQASTLRFYNPGADGASLNIDNLANNGIVTFQHSANTGYTVANVKTYLVMV